MIDHSPTIIRDLENELVTVKCTCGFVYTVAHSAHYIEMVVVHVHVEGEVYWSTSKLVSDKVCDDRES